MTLTPTGEAGHYDFKTNNVYFFMNNGYSRVRCAVTEQALEKCDPDMKRGGRSQLDCFNSNRDRIEFAASAQFDLGYVEDDGTVFVKAENL